MRKKWKSSVACLLACTMMFTNSVLIVNAGETEKEQKKGIASQAIDDEELEPEVYMDVRSDDELFPYGWYDMYYGEALTLIAKAYEEIDGEEVGIKGVSYGWKLKDTKDAAITIQQNGDKCKIIAGNKDGIACLLVTASMDGKIICEYEYEVTVTSTKLSETITKKDVYTHPGDVLSINDFEPQLKKYVNGKESEIVPANFYFYVYEDEDYKDEEISTNADKTLLTVSSNILNGTNGTYEKYISIMCSVRECWPKIKVHYFTGNWTTASAATVSASEKQVRKCQVCGKSEERTVGSKLKAKIESNKSSVTLLPGQSDKSLKVTFQKGDSVKSWKSSDTKIAAVSGKANGTCTIKAGKKTGTAKITIRTTAGAEKTINVKVQKATLKFNASSITLKTGQSTRNFKAMFREGDSVKSWKSSNKKIATVSGKANGTCTLKAGKKTGTAKITIKTAAGASKTIKVKVQKSKVTTNSIKEVPKKITVKRRKTYKLTPSIQPITSADKVKYSSENKKVATVSAKGVIKGKKAGKTKITVTAGKKKAVCTVIVKK